MSEVFYEIPWIGRLFVADCFCVFYPDHFRFPLINVFTWNHLILRPLEMNYQKLRKLSAYVLHNKLFWISKFFEIHHNIYETNEYTIVTSIGVWYNQTLEFITDIRFTLDKHWNSWHVKSTIKLIFENDNFLSNSFQL